MRQSFSAIFEDGVLRSLETAGIVDRARVRITIEVEETHAEFEGCVGTISAEDADQVRRSVEDAFEREALDE